MAAKLDKIFQDMDAFCEEVIEEHMKPNRPKSMEGDIIDVMLRMKRDGSASFDITLDHIKALLVGIIIGGSDGTATALEWALTALMKKPSSMKKVQAEIRQLAGKKEMIDEEDIEKLPYLRAVVKETLRLFPPGPLLLPRETIKKCSINGYVIEGGTMVYINAWAIARDPTTWENADEFLPERFLAAEIDVRGQNPKVIPFGFGRRGCPGIGMGMSAIELALANVLHKFEWELPHGMKEEDIDFDSEPGFGLHKKNALRLVAKVVM
ncbi:5-OH-xanthotoxin synthase-like [Salvia miltiorrhiza]|uniref:5-OH-xanthotoxin synthase-like n=1 Tax=Salvia miltiorrhiza TaxID=226208 RepID=UPI0025AC9423|nr:5-OH-xanthotoxin synthase-like [Salvia miltiorrhiza]